MLKVDNGDHTKVDHDDQAKDETKAFWRKQPKIYERSDKDDLYQPSSQTALCLAVCAGAQSQIILPCEWGLAVTAFWLAEAARDRQHI